MSVAPSGSQRKHGLGRRNQSVLCRSPISSVRLRPATPASAKNAIKLLDIYGTCRTIGDVAMCLPVGADHG